MLALRGTRSRELAHLTSCYPSHPHFSHLSKNFRISVIPMTMKRKLNEDDVPEPDNRTQKASTTSTFESFGLESRLLQALAKQNYATPTDVQSEAIPLALAGKDVLARSKTGSGKTVAYLLPILQSILKQKNADRKAKCTIALILAPTKELAQQITQVIGTLSTFCSHDVGAVNLTQKASESVQETLLAELPDIVVATPSRVAEMIKKASFDVGNLKHLVIDEADLVLSYGYEDDVQAIAQAIPKGIQTSLMSATLTTEVETLKAIFCRDPVIVDLKEASDDAGGVSQYVVRCAEEEKFLLIYVVYKLKLIKGKSIIFVGDIDRSYRLKLYLEQFGIKSCILNSELPVNSRIHVVEEFNKNVYDIIIASDEHEVVGAQESHAKRGAEPNEEDAEDHESGQKGTGRQTRKRLRKTSKSDKEYGIARGIDFQNVACVLNFDLPTSARSYTHRIGRTARAGKTGMALSFVIPSANYRKHKPTTFHSTKNDEEVLAAITADQASKGQEVKPYHFDMKQVDAFRYRMNDALRAVTGVTVREARIREIEQELLKSEKLKRYFEENPDDLRQLRHDTELSRPKRIQAHLKHVPDYLMPAGGAKRIVKDVGFVGLNKPEGEKNRIRRVRDTKRKNGKPRGSSKAKGKGADPLKTFKARGKR